MTREQAIALAKTGWWKNRSAEDIVGFQLFEDMLCMDFRDFHGAVEKALGRPVFTHEFGSVGVQGLRREFLKEKPAPTFEEIVNLIPEAKRIIILG